MPKRYLHIIERIDDTYGGPAKSIPLLCKMLQDEGIENQILSVNQDHESNEYIERFHISWQKCKPTIGRYFSIQFIWALLHQVKKADVIHLHSCWSFPSLLFMVLSVFLTGKKVFFSPRSSLEPKSLQKKRLFKLIIRKLIVNNFVRKSDAVFCSSQYEQNGLHEIYPHLTNIKILPNNLDLNFNAAYDKEAARENLNLPENSLVIAFVSRVHSRKRLDYLVDLWLKLVNEEFPDLYLLIAGPIDEKVYFQAITEKVKKSSQADQFIYYGTLTGPQRLKCFIAADIFILPSEFESFGMAIAESLTAGTPVLVSDTTPWHEINKANCGWCIDISQFEETLKKFLKLDQVEKKLMSKNAQSFIQQHFSNTNSVVQILEYLK
jgi:glycosyltransferase involved in cell wall biosynthesis